MRSQAKWTWGRQLVWNTRLVLGLLFSTQLVDRHSFYGLFDHINTFNIISINMDVRSSSGLLVTLLKWLIVITHQYYWHKKNDSDNHKTINGKIKEIVHPTLRLGWYWCIRDTFLVKTTKFKWDFVFHKIWKIKFAGKEVPKSAYLCTLPNIIWAKIPSWPLVAEIKSKTSLISPFPWLFKTWKTRCRWWSAGDSWSR